MRLQFDGSSLALMAAGRDFPVFVVLGPALPEAAVKPFIALR